MLLPLLRIFFIPLLVQATDKVAPDITLLSDSSLKASELHFQAPRDHHFNEKAPNQAEVKVETKWVKADQIQINKDKLNAHWETSHDFCAGLKLRLFVCDNGNTYCLPKTYLYQCRGGKLVQGEAIQPIQSAQPGQPDQVASQEKSLFILNEPEKALALAKENKKPLLIDFFGIWCPPCNMLDENVFNQTEFEKHAQNFVLLKLDADSKVSWPLKSKFKVGGYPTVVFASTDGEEINRLVGYRAPKVFYSYMEQAYSKRHRSFDELKLAADDKQGSTAAYQVGLTYLDRGEFQKAHYYLFKASRSWPTSDIRRNKLLSAALGMHSTSSLADDRKIYERMLEDAIDWYPRQPEVFDRAEELSKVAEDLHDPDVVHKALDTQISTATWYLTHPKAMRQGEWTRGDFFETMADAYDQLGDKEKAQNAYLKGAEEYLKDIRASGHDENTERGNNLERFYCLWKAGKTDDAAAFYEKFEKLFPEEFTFYYQHGRMLQALNKSAAAEEKAKLAMKYSYGDNRLRAAELLALAYNAQGEKKKALGVIDGAMSDANLPDDKTIRTHRYYDKLAVLKKKLSG